MFLGKSPEGLDSNDDGKRDLSSQDNPETMVKDGTNHFDKKSSIE